MSLNRTYLLVFPFFAAAIVFVVAEFIAYTDRAEIRYSTLPCMYEKVFVREGAADVVILGSSRAMQGISSEILAKEIAGGAAVLNLAHSWRGYGVLYRQLKDIVENIGAPSVILMEMSYFAYNDSRTTTYYYGYYPNYSIVVDSGDFLSDYNSKPREPAYSKFRDVVGHYVTRLDKHLSILLTGGSNKTLNLADRVPVKTVTASCFKKDNKIKPNTLIDVRNRIARSGKSWQTFSPRRWDIRTINEDRANYYVQKIRDLALESGSKLFLVLIPKYLESPVDEEFLIEAEAQYDLTVLHPTIEVMDHMYSEDGYTDATHMNKTGRTIFSTWLGKELVNRNSDQNTYDQTKTLPD